MCLLQLRGLRQELRVRGSELLAELCLKPREGLRLHWRGLRASAARRPVAPRDKFRLGRKRHSCFRVARVAHQLVKKPFLPLLRLLPAAHGGKTGVFLRCLPPRARPFVVRAAQVPLRSLRPGRRRAFRISGGPCGALLRLHFDGVHFFHGCSFYAWKANFFVCPLKRRPGCSGRLRRMRRMLVRLLAAAQPFRFAVSAAGGAHLRAPLFTLGKRLDFSALPANFG